MDVKVTWQGRMTFKGEGESQFTVPLGTDTKVGGDNDGFRPMELIELGLAGCTAMDVISILMKKKQEGVGGQLPPSQQVYEAEAASHGRKKDRVRELQMKYLDPMLRLAAKNGWDLEKDVGELAYARAALESNERLRLRSAKHFLNELAKAVPAYPARKLKEDWKAMKDLLRNDPAFQAMSPQMRKRTIQQNTYNMLKQAVQDMQQRYPSEKLTEFVEAFEAIDRQPTGMTDIDAQHIMTRWRGRADWADMQQLLDLFDQMNRGSITAYVQSGMMTQEMAAQWMAAYQH